MIFTSISFFLFFAIYFLAYYFLPKKFNLYLIIFGSLVFYGWWDVYLAFIPILLTAIAFVGAVMFSNFVEQRHKKAGLIVTIVCLLLPLIFFKYINFFYVQVLGLVADGERDKIILYGIPLGISFITFTLISYAVDVYRGVYQKVSDFKVLLGYVLFFPQLIAGPILRPAQLIPQLQKRHRIATFRTIKAGLLLVVLGVVKKVIVADKIALAIDPVFEQGFSGNEWLYVLAVYGFTVQIYCDFSGYTDIAIGLAKMLGVRLPKNFERPYMAVSLVDFWRRWHITLSFWLRDYLYISIGGARLGMPRRIFNILITMLLGGLWHGANWTFLVWGLLHGLVISATHLTRGIFASVSVPRFLSIFLTGHFVAITWVFFRAPDLTTAWNVLNGLSMVKYDEFLAFLGVHFFEVSLIILFFLSHKWDREAYFRKIVRNMSNYSFFTIVIFILTASMILSHGSSGQFIYFDF